MAAAPSKSGCREKDFLHAEPERFREWMLRQQGKGCQLAAQERAYFILI